MKCERNGNSGEKKRKRMMARRKRIIAGRKRMVKEGKGGKGM
jgi:hypothetical protein